MSVDERERQAEFLERHKVFYDELVKRLSDAVKKGDNEELALHAQYVAKIVETALNLRLHIERMEEGTAFHGGEYVD